MNWDIENWIIPNEYITTLKKIYAWRKYKSKI